MSAPARTAPLRFKDLCLDVVDPEVAARFWAPALGLQVERRGAHLVLHDDVLEHTVWLNPVPEPKTVKHRVHLDVHTGAVADLLELGAESLGQVEGWTGLRDPEGGELDAFVRPPDQLPRYRLYEIAVDATDPERIAAWWAELLGVEVGRDEQHDFCWVEGAPGLPAAMVFAPVPEPKQVKNRLHWDVWGATTDAVAAGAQLLRARDEEIRWDVLADPEGNEFCVFAPADAP